MPHRRGRARVCRFSHTFFRKKGWWVDKETASFAEFARRLGCKRGYVTALRQADRLVLTEDGRHVCIAESLARIKATRDPAKIAVAARHAAARAADASSLPSQSEPPQTPAGETQDDPAATLGFQHWRERNERAKALAGERDNAIAEGKLLDAGDVERALADATTALRARLESLPDTLGPQLAAIDDEGRVRALLAGEIEHALEECARQFSAAARRAEATQ